MIVDFWFSALHVKWKINYLVFSSFILKSNVHQIATGMFYQKAQKENQEEHLKDKRLVKRVLEILEGNKNKLDAFDD